MSKENNFNKFMKISEFETPKVKNNENTPPKTLRR